MSAEDDGGAGRREVAYRLFAAEYDDATLEHSDSTEERAPNYVVTPTGARVNRLFAVGVLTEVESVSEDVLRARVVDPTGAFVIYAGQYQPDAQTFLERAEPPMFVAVTGKARTYEPEDGDRVFTSVRPESVNEVDADTRDRWTVQAAAHTLERVRTMAAALERPERGGELTAALRADGVAPGLAEGIPLAIDHYGTTTAYLAAVRDVAIEAAEVVLGEREEVDPLDLAPDEGGEASLDVDIDLEAVAPGIGAEGIGEGDEPEAAEPTTAAADASGGDAEAESAAAEDSPEAESPEAGTDDTATAGQEPAEDSEPAVATTEPEDVEDEPRAGAEVEEGDEAAGTTEPDEEGADELGDFDDFGDDEGVETDDMYELDEEERREVEEEFGTEFSTGTEVDEPGAADIGTPEEAGEPEAEGTDAEASGVEEAPTGAEAAGTEADTTAAESEEEPADAAVADESAGTADLEDAAMDAMRDLDDGDGADRDAVIEAVVDAHGADPAEVEDAIQDALMGGRCYEPDDGRLKAI